MNPVDLPALGAFALHTVMVVLVMGIALGLSALLGGYRRDTRILEPFESGVQPFQPALRHSWAPYYLIAVYFLIFDMEVAVLFAWTVAVREAGWLGFIEAAIFILILLAGLFYLWADGALSFRSRRPAREGGA